MKERDFAPSTVLAVAFCGLVLAFGSALLEHQGFLAPPPEKVDQASQKRTVADIRNTGTAMFSWLTDQVGAAAAGQSQLPKIVDLADYREISQADLQTLLVPNYMQEVPEVDGWGNSYEYYLDKDNPLAEKVMGIRSPGRDGVFAATSYEVGAFDPADFDQDVVWNDGFFVRWPQQDQNRR